MNTFYKKWEIQIKLKVNEKFVGTKLESLQFCRN